jgi:DNA helicase-2/ATP-dependent DNA helicase PcrA
MEDGVFPHSRSIESGDLEEERRLAYVGATRAKDRLHLTFARTRALYGSRNWNLPSRFIEEVPEHLVEREGAPEPRAPSRAQAAATTWRRSGEAPTPPPRREPRPGATFTVGEDVVHAQFGDGVVTALDPGGLVQVRFAEDGSERKLMADYAPLKTRGDG